MTNQFAISPEIARLAEKRTRAFGVTLADELARNVVQEAIVNLDPEAGFLLDGQSYSEQDSLVAAFGINDVIVNGCRFDVRTVDAEGRVAISRALINTGYLQTGTLTVQMHGPLNGSVVGFISAKEWQAIDEHAGDQQTVYVRAKAAEDFDLEKLMSEQVKEDKPVQANAPELFEIATLVANRAELAIERQRLVVDGTLARPEIWGQVDKVVSLWSKGSMKKILAGGSAWNKRVEKLADLLCPKFSKLSRQDITTLVAKLGESFGGQPEAPEFRKALMVTLTREELAHNLGGALLKKATSVAEEVLSGRSVTDAVKDFAKNKVAVDLATAIKSQREKVRGFAEATSQEIAAAFQTLSLQPVYATHSQDPQAGIESINEALKILEAAEIAENLKDIEAELANL